MSVVALNILAFLVALAAFFRAWFDRKELQHSTAKVVKEAAEAKRLLNFRTQLATEVAHEIKNPLAAIISSVEALDHILGDSIDPQLKNSLKYIKDNGHHTLRLISDFLEVNKFHFGVTIPHPGKVCVNHVVESAAGLLRSYAIKKKITLVATGLEKKMWAHVDSRHIKQILFNLVHNAIKFTPERGNVTINISEDPTSPRVIISVQDTGPGIPQEEIYNIFDPYVQGKNQNSAELGVGLGLTLCRRLVMLAGGQITVSSTPGCGSIFEFWVPKFTEKTSSKAVPLVESKISTPISIPEVKNTETKNNYLPLTGQAFLIVDNNHQSSDAITKLIEAWGGMVDHVTQATDAVDALARKNYDAVMLDNSADGLQGHEVATLLRDQASQKGTTIILASEEPMDEAQAQDFGVDKCIEKPLKGDDLLRSLIATGKFQMTH